MLSKPASRAVRKVVEVQPVAVARVHKALGAQDDAVLYRVRELAEDLAQLRLAVLARRLLAPARKHLVGVVVMMVMLMLLIPVVIVVMVAFAFGIVALLAVMVVMVMFVLFVFVVIVVMMALAFGIVALLAIMVMVVLVLLVFLVMVMLMLEALHLGSQAVLVHGLADHPALKLVPGRCDQPGVGVQAL